MPYTLRSPSTGAVDYFCTCDDVFLRKAKRELFIETKAVSPIELKEILSDVFPNP